MFDQKAWKLIEADLRNMLVAVSPLQIETPAIDDLLEDVRAIAAEDYDSSMGSLFDFCKRTAIRLIKRGYGAWILEGDTVVPDSQATTVKPEPEEEGADVSLPYWFPRSEEGRKRWRKIADVLTEQEREYSDEGLKPPAMTDRRTRMSDHVGYTRGDDTIHRILKARRKGWI